jgi:hypothetical protein
MLSEPIQPYRALYRAFQICRAFRLCRVQGPIAFSSQPHKRTAPPAPNSNTPSAIATQCRSLLVNQCAMPSQIDFYTSRLSHISKGPAAPESTYSDALFHFANYSHFCLFPTTPPFLVSPNPASRSPSQTTFKGSSIVK